MELCFGHGFGTTRVEPQIPAQTQTQVCVCAPLRASDCQGWLGANVPNPEYHQLGEPWEGQQNTKQTSMGYARRVSGCLVWGLRVSRVRALGGQSAWKFQV